LNEINICNELHKNFIDFAYEANSQRAFPDARDGLKPGQRACLWEMYIDNYNSSKPHVKSAKISGAVISRLWPHSDDAIYETFARMSQSWVNNIPEVDWHGSNGNLMIGSAPASKRYTEARLSKATEIGMLQGLKKNNVNMILNYSEDEEWAEVLPALFPRLLINGCQGIGVSISNFWFPCNLRETTEVIKEYVRTGEVNTSLPLFDVPTGGIILNKDELPHILETGTGSIIMRAKMAIEGASIIITELPYQVYVEPLLDKIKGLIQNGTLNNVTQVLNKSDKNRLLLEIKFKKEEFVESGYRTLLEKTNLQKSYKICQNALVNGVPKLLNLKEYLDVYISHNLECIRREHLFDLEKAKDRLEIVEGLIIALEDIDNIIHLIKSSANQKEAKEVLKDKYNLSERQANSIVIMQLGKLAHLEYLQLLEEKNNLLSTIAENEAIINDKNKLINIFLDRLISFTEEFGGDRKTAIETVKNEGELKKGYSKDAAVIVYKDGKVLKTTYDTGKRIKDILRSKINRGDINPYQIITNFFSTFEIDSIIFFLSTGRIVSIPVKKIPEKIKNPSSRAFEGFITLNDLLKKKQEEKVVKIIPYSELKKYKYFTVVTKKGKVKRTLTEECNDQFVKDGIGLNKDDQVADIIFADDGYIMLISTDGYVNRFSINETPLKENRLKGVEGIKLHSGEKVANGLFVSDEEYLALFTKKGNSKKISLKDIPVRIRGGFGDKIYEYSKDVDKVSVATLINKDEQILLCGRIRFVTVPFADIPTELNENDIKEKSIFDDERVESLANLSRI
jgi:DNA gyrase subunit A